MVVALSSPASSLVAEHVAGGSAMRGGRIVLSARDVKTIPGRRGPGPPLTRSTHRIRFRATGTSRRQGDEGRAPDSPRARDGRSGPGPAGAAPVAARALVRHG